MANDKEKLALQFKEIQSELGFSNKEMAHELRTSNRSIDNWRSGQIKVPGPVIVAMYCMREKI